MKMKILTEEEYKRLEEDPDWSQDDIKNLVDQLREAAWQDYLMENDDSDDDWYQDMLEDEETNRKIDEKIEEAYDDSYDYYRPQSAVLKQARLTIREKVAEHLKTVKVKAPEDELNRILSHAIPSEQPQEITLEKDDGTTVNIEGREINIKKVRLETPSETKVSIHKTTDTEVHKVKGSEDTVIKKTTTIVETPQPEKTPETKEEKIATIVAEKRKRKTVICEGCGNEFAYGQHNFRECKRRKQNGREFFCVYCMEEHTSGVHTRELACPWCDEKFKNISAMRNHHCESKNSQRGPKTSGPQKN